MHCLYLALSQPIGSPEAILRISEKKFNYIVVRGEEVGCCLLQGSMLWVLEERRQPLSEPKCFGFFSWLGGQRKEEDGVGRAERDHEVDKSVLSELLSDILRSKTIRGESGGNPILVAAPYIF